MSDPRITAADVTEEQRRQGELFRLMVQNTPDYAIFVTDPDGRVQTWSPAAQALLGYREEEVAGQPADRFFTPEDRQLGAPAQELQQALTSGHAEAERWYVRNDGSRLWASATTTALRGPGQRVRGFATIMRDSTDRRRAEDAQAYAESIVETVREPLLILDADLRVQRANRSFYSTFGVAPQDTERRLLYDLGDGQWDIPALRRLLVEILPRNTAFHDFEVVHDFPSIGRKVMLLNARRLDREGNHTACILLAIEDITERRRVEEALAVQQEWQRVTLRSIGDAVITTDVSGRVTYLNPAAETLTGWTTAEARGLPLETVFQIVNEETRKKAENPVTKSLREGQVVGLANHTILISKGGGERSIDDSAAPIRAAGGEVKGVVLTFRDITDRRTAERAAQAALEYAENTVETVREPLLVLDGDLRVRTANTSFYRTFRVTPAETENRLLYDLGNGQWDIPALRVLLGEILPQQTSFNDFEVTHDFESVGRKVMLLNARRVRRDGADTGLILLAIEDITERRRIEEERRELETRFTSLVKNIRDHSIFTLDPQGRITSWNREAERILGYAEAEVLGQPFSVIFTVEDVARGVPGLELRTALAEGRAEDERWHLRKNGERFWALGIVTPTQDATGGHTGFSKILRDMTDRKRMDEELRRSRDELDERVRRRTAELEEAHTRSGQAERLAAIGQIAAGLAHESRNALQRIQACLSMLALRVPDNRDALDIIDRAQRAQDDLHHLFDDVRSYAASLEPRPVATDLAAVWREAWADLVAVRGSDSAELCEHVEGADAMGAIDPFHFKGVFRNLFENALSAGADRVEVSARRLPAAPGGQEALEVRVRDNGPGFPPALRPRLFEPFFTTKTHGTGLGLAICRRIVEAHGGRIEAGEGGPGAEIRITLPRRTP